MAQAGGAAALFCGDGLLVCVGMLPPPPQSPACVTVGIPGVLTSKKIEKNGGVTATVSASRPWAIGEIRHGL
jgi:hypothetical protein